MHGISQGKAMDHGEAIQMMAAERYLLDELTPGEKDAFEQHLFDCRDCALDLRAGATFVTEAKTELAEMNSQAADFTAVRAAGTQPRKKFWSILFQPAFVVPAFAVMLAVIAWQNVSTIPSLHRDASGPRILRSYAIHAGTRGTTPTAVLADRTVGLAFAIELPQSSTYSSYTFELQDASGKEEWTRNFTPSNADNNDGVVSLLIPGAGLAKGSYTLSTFGISAQRGRVEIDRRVLDVQFGN